MTSPTESEDAQPRAWVPPGHFYSPFPSAADIRRHYGSQTAPYLRGLPGIDMNETGQRQSYDRVRALYGQEQFAETRSEGHRYFYRNDQYGYGDAFLLFCVMRLLQPKRIVEVGSGFSSAMMLDTNDRHLGGAVDCTFIEPHPERLQDLLADGDLRRHELIQRPVQDVGLDTFQALQEGDILFVDSSHVAKVGGDVNYLLFEVLPALQGGVWIHFHDVPWPFEYPRAWVEEGRAWNEAYMVRAFLQFNAAFRIELSAGYLTQGHEQDARRELPRCMEDLGSALWISKR